MSTHSSDPLTWLREQLAKFEHALKCRESGEATWRAGTDESWRKVAAMHGGAYYNKAKRLQLAEKEKRIAVWCRNDVAMCKAILAIVEKEQSEKSAP